MKKVAVVTGATSGIGLESAVDFANAGLHVVVVARNRAKGEGPLAAVRARVGDENAIALETCELESLAEVRALGSRLLEKYERIDVLVNNAGSVSDKRRLTVDGFESTFAINHLAPFLLTNLLLERLIATAKLEQHRAGCVRVVNVSSASHMRGTMPFDDLHFERERYFIMSAYERSKLANVLFTRELARRLAARADAGGINVSAMHPGTVSTSIWQKAPWFARPVLNIRKLWMISAREGGARITHLALSPDVANETGGYYAKNRLTTPSKIALDDNVARRLWDMSAEMVGLPR